MLSQGNFVGLDIENINPKIEKIAHKFLTPGEIEAIPEHEKIEKLILMWSAKEALYKLYSMRGIEFKTQLLLSPFSIAQSGSIAAQIIAGGKFYNNLNINYLFFNGHVLSHVEGKMD
ncbi:MAG TPA: 4'-phosphopantetheinyl transferase superfamily protein, partial [Chitinophagales bacterium]|nr:4'-phosphopantetheinyl transferase superfamily protein [Chitinophagales bacterium]